MLLSGKHAAVALLLAALAFVGPHGGTHAQLIVSPTESTCATNRVFLGSVGDELADYEPLTGVFLGHGNSSDLVTRYTHEHDTASLQLYRTAGGQHVWYVAAGAAAAGTATTLAEPAAVADERDAPLGYIRSVTSSGAVPPWQAVWQVWTAGEWRPAAGAQLAATDAACSATLRARCVGGAWGACSAGRLHVRGMPATGDSGASMESAPMAGHLAGAAEPEFPAGAPPLSTAESDDTADYRPFPEADPPYPGEPDETARPRLGTFLLTDSVHVNRPVYRHVHHATYLYFDYLVRVDGSHVPLWIIGPEPRRLPSLDSWRLLFVIDAARRPEAITGCWQYRTGRRQTAALVDVRCEHGRVGPAPAAGADCDFELPGGCGYRAGSGQLTQTQYTSQGRAAAHRADAADPGSFHAEVAPAADLSADVTSPTFTTETDSCLTLVYRMRTRQYFRASFELVGDSLDVALTLASAERGWARLAHPVPPGSYRLKVRGHMSAAADRLLFDSVRVLAGNCSRPALPCDQQPCRNGGTCHPLDAKVYTCACRAGFQSAGCQASVTCAPPPAVRDGRLLATSAPGDSLPTARYECLAGTTFASPLTRTIASCVRGRWLGVPSCVHGRDTSEREREKDDHDAASTDPRGAGPGLTSSVTSVCGLATLLATVAAQLWT